MKRDFNSVLGLLAFIGWGLALVFYWRMEWIPKKIIECEDNLKISKWRESTCEEYLKKNRDLPIKSSEFSYSINGSIYYRIPRD